MHKPNGTMSPGAHPGPALPNLANLLGCPWCNHPVESARGPGIIVAEPVVCFHCHGIAIDFAGKLRKPTAAELDGFDWDAYRQVCRDLTEQHGPPALSTPHRTPFTKR